MEAKMNKGIVLDTFFHGNLEKNINEKMLNRDYSFPCDQIFGYIDNLCDIDFKEYIDYIYNDTQLDPVLPKNIFQFSSFDDCTIHICECIKEIGDNGYRFDEIGKMLLKDNKERNLGALKKYGENAAKTATELGLLQNIENYFFLTCIGYVYPDLNEEIRKKITALLIIRSTFFKNLIANTKYGMFDVHWLMLSLGESTQKRRLPNIKTMINYLKRFESDDINNVFNKVII